MDIDDEGLEAYSDASDDVATSSRLEDVITDSDVVRDSTNKCNVIANLVSTGKHIIGSLHNTHYMSIQVILRYCMKL